MIDPLGRTKSLTPRFCVTSDAEALKSSCMDRQDEDQQDLDVTVYLWREDFLDGVTGHVFFPGGFLRSRG